AGAAVAAVVSWVAALSAACFGLPAWLPHAATTRTTSASANFLTMVPPTLMRSPHIGRDDLGVALQITGRPLEHQLALLEYVGVVGDLQGQFDVLLDEQHGHFLFTVEHPEALIQLVDEHRRQPEGRLVDHEQAGPGDQRPG